MIKEDIVGHGTYPVLAAFLSSCVVLAPAVESLYDLN